MKHLYLIHSSDAEWVTRQRELLVDSLVPREERDENLLDIYSTSSRQLELAKIVQDIIGDLSTIPFLPGSRRVVVVHNIADLLRGSGSSGGTRQRAAKGGRKKADAPARKRTPLEILRHFVEKDLPETGNVLIFSTVIEFDRGQDIDDKGPFYRMFQELPVARIMKPDMRETNPIFLMGDALLARDTVGCLRHFRSIYRDDARGRIFSEMLRNVRFLLEANVLGRMEAKGGKRDILEMKYLPGDKRLNLYQQADFVQKKIRRHADSFTLRELMQAMERLLEINRSLYPAKDAAYVPDVRLLLETFVVEFCEGARA